MVETQKAENNLSLILALKDLKKLHEKTEKNLLTGGEIIRVKETHKAINEFINETKERHRKSSYDGISDSKTLKDLNITPKNIDQYVVRNRSSNEILEEYLIKELKDKKKELNAYLKKNKKNRHEDAFAESVQDLIEIRKEIKIREELRDEVKLTLGIEPEKFYRKYDLSLLENQEKNRLKEKIKNNYRTLRKKDVISQEEISTFHNDLCSYIDKAKLNSQKSFYDMRTSKTAARSGINVINDARKKDTGTLSVTLARLTDQDLKKEKTSLNVILKKSSNDVENRDFNHGLNEIAVYKEEFEIRKRLVQLDKTLGIDVKKIYSKSSASFLTVNDDYQVKWDELRDKFRAADSPHILKNSNITKEDTLEQRTSTVASNRESEPIYAEVVLQKDSSVPSIPHSNVRVSNDAVDSPIPMPPPLLSNDAVDSPIPVPSPLLSNDAVDSHIPIPPPMPGERPDTSKSVQKPIEAINSVIESDYAEIPEVVSGKQHIEKTEVVKKEPLYAKVNMANKKKYRMHAAENQAVPRNTNLENVTSKDDLVNELKTKLAARKKQFQPEENKNSQFTQNQNPEQKHSIAALTGIRSKMPPTPPPRKREKKQPVETLKTIGKVQADLQDRKASMAQKIQKIEEKLAVGRAR